MLLRAQARAAQGNTAAAGTLRRDSGALALYGFGSDRAAAARRDEIALLARPQ
jgi:hypothetical protein